MVLGKNIAYDFDAQPFRLLAKARSHLRYTKTHFSCNEKCWSCYTRRVFQGRYNRLDLKLQFAITTNLYMLPERELAKSRSDFD